MASSNPWERELATAQEAVLRAARLTKTVLSSVTELSKADSSPVTVADFAAQALLIRILHAAFPDDKFVGEEDSTVLRGNPALRDKVFELYCSAAGQDAQAEGVEEMLQLIDLGGHGQGGSQGRFWAIDPIDGTATFLTGKQYAVAAALIHHGTEVLAAIAYPNMRLLDNKVHEDSVDTQGLGILLSGARNQPITKTRLTSQPPYQTEILTPLARNTPIHPVDCDKNNPAQRAVMKTLCEKMGVSFPGTDVWSSHVRYASLILGGGDFLVRLPRGPDGHSCIWDHAGAQLMFRELGGWITDLDGREVDFGAGRCLSGNRGLVIARDGVLHGEVLRGVREIMGE